MYSTEINELIDYSYILGFKGEHHARAGQLVVILKKGGNYLDPFFFFRLKMITERNAGLVPFSLCALMQTDLPVKL